MNQAETELVAAPAPTISVILPVHDPALRDLERAVASVDRQVWPHRELCVADDGSSDPEIVGFLDVLAERADVRFVRRREVGGISAATNAALELARGAFALFLDHDDELTEDAVTEFVRVLQRHPDADVVYSDHDLIDEGGQRIGTDFKPGWSPELLLSYMYVGHAKLVRTSLMRALGGMRSGFEGAADYDLMLRIAEWTDRVYHVPSVLYHWRAARGSMAYHSDRKTHAFESGRRAVQEAVQRRKLGVRVDWPGWARRSRVGVYHLDFESTGDDRITVLVSVTHSGATLQRCVESIERRTRHGQYRIAVRDADSRLGNEDAAWLAQRSHRLLSRDVAPGLQAAVALLETEFVVFLDDDLLVVEPRWLDELLGFARMEGVGAVGAKIARRDGAIAHAGLLLGVHGGLESAFRGCRDSHSPLEHGYYAHVPRNCSAVSASCMLTRRSTFLEADMRGVEGLTPLLFGTDFSLRLRQRGVRVVLNPCAELLRVGEAAVDEVSVGEVGELRARWGEQLVQDPYFNSNFSRLDSGFSLRVSLDERPGYRFGGGLREGATPRPDLHAICRAQEDRIRSLSDQLAALETAGQLAHRLAPLLRRLRRSPLLQRFEGWLRRSRFKPTLARMLRRLKLLD